MLLKLKPGNISMQALACYCVKFYIFAATSPLFVYIFNRKFCLQEILTRGRWMLKNLSLNIHQYAKFYRIPIRTCWVTLHRRGIHNESQTSVVTDQWHIWIQFVVCIIIHTTNWIHKTWQKRL